MAPGLVTSWEVETPVRKLCEQMGYKVELLDSDALTNADLSVYDTIVIGIRASETNDSYVANNQRLLDYTKNGGTMIVQYQKWAYQRLNLAPFPFSYNARVSDETAPIEILEPNHPVFNTPNQDHEERLSKVGFKSEICTLFEHLTNAILLYSSLTIQERMRTKAGWYMRNTVTDIICTSRTHSSDNCRQAFRAHIASFQMWSQ